jgi:hypothetical protein
VPFLAAATLDGEALWRIFISGQSISGFMLRGLIGLDNGFFMV